METRQTNKDCARAGRRNYHLSMSGLESLRRSAAKTMPWQWSTGSKTVTGKARSRRNALKHGDRAAETIAIQRQLSGVFRELRRLDRKQGRQLDVEGYGTD